MLYKTDRHTIYLSLSVLMPFHYAIRACTCVHCDRSRSVKTSTTNTLNEENDYIHLIQIK